MKTWTKWPAVRKIEAITTVWQPGMSADEIAQAMNSKYEISVGRNAVIGFYHRVATRNKNNRSRNLLAEYPLIRPSTMSNRQRKAKVARQAESKVRKRTTEGLQRARVVPKIESIPFDDLPREGYGVKLTALKDGCRWPTDERNGKTLFCNHYVHKGSYCAQHYRRSVRFDGEADSGLEAERGGSVLGTRPRPFDQDAVPSHLPGEGAPDDHHALAE